jgi:hypothetical protein
MAPGIQYSTFMAFFIGAEDNCARHVLTASTVGILSGSQPVKPKPPFRPVFQVATTREGSGITLINEPLDPEDPEARSCSWWRRGRVELPVQRSLPKIYYRLS